MARRAEEYNDSERYDADYDDEASYYAEEAPRYTPARRATGRRRPDALAQEALDWGISGSILAILIVTALYLFSPLDLIPDLIPVAGQVDDVAAILSGGGAITFLAVLRFVLRTRIGRWSCLITIILASIGAFTLFWLLYHLFSAIL